ncbi:MAG TPA: G1 family glutamic endopeptidase [Acidimicrobiales bacterium]|nr:G1 family glutamic endopeptidase [Acidimicrobiales bacterium]
MLAAHLRPAKLPPSGGWVLVSARVRHADNCQTEPVSTGALRVALPPRADCGRGVYTASVRVGPNATGVPQEVTLALVARDPKGWYTAPLRVLVMSAPPAAPAWARLTRQAVSYKWSGYVAVGGPFYRVSGTFRVPFVPPAATCGELVSEWVGVDGSTNRSLIQAGVSEGDVDAATGACRPGHPSAWVWWEVLPAGSTPVPSVPVAMGDEVTVSVWHGSAKEWGIHVTNDASGASFGLRHRYDGAAQSAEWVVEAPTDPAACTSDDPLTPGVCEVAPYEPSVPFTKLQLGGTATQVREDSLWQGGRPVSVPSSLAAGGFTVAYAASPRR